MKQSPTHSPVRTLIYVVSSDLNTAPWTHLRLVDIGDNLERSLNTILIDLTRLHGLDVIFTREAQNVECILASDGDQLSRSEEHTSELQSRLHLVCRLL